MDAPELVKHIKSQFRKWEAQGIECFFDNAHLQINNMHNLIVRKGAPTRLKRFCCEYLKECHSDGRVTVTGVRWSESLRRKLKQGVVTLYNTKDKLLTRDDNDIGRMVTENCTLRSRITLNPIVDWTEKDVWNFIRTRKLEYCPLYDEGWLRLGCVGCPMSGTKQQLKQFARWPHIKKYYLRSFADYINAHPETAARHRWETAEDMFHWWIADGHVKGQVGMDFLNEED